MKTTLNLFAGLDNFLSSIQKHKLKRNLNLGSLKDLNNVRKMIFVNPSYMD